MTDTRPRPAAGSPEAMLDAERLIWLDGLVEPGECAAILDELRWAWWWPSTIVRTNAEPDGRRDDRRRSETTTEWWFTERLATMMRDIERRLQAALGIDPRTLERWQATRYGPGGRFDPHLDVGLYGGQPAGERELTALLYLHAPASGGETEFPCLDLRVEPEPGRLLVWANLLPDGTVDRTMRHASRPVGEGAKVTLITWTRQRAIRPRAEEDAW